MRSKIREMARPHLLPSYAGYQKGRELDLSIDRSYRAPAVLPGMIRAVSWRAMHAGSSLK